MATDGRRNQVGRPKVTATRAKPKAQNPIQPTTDLFCMNVLQPNRLPDSAPSADKDARAPGLGRGLDRLYLAFDRYPGRIYRWICFNFFFFDPLRCLTQAQRIATIAFDHGRAWMVRSIATQDHT